MRLSHASGLVTILALVLSGGCDASGPDEGLYSRVAVDRVRLVRGETMTITVSVFKSRADATLVGSSSCPIGYRVLDHSGATVAPLDVACTDDLATTPIPDDGLVLQITWRGRTGNGDGGDPLPAGIYRIVGGPGPPGLTRGSVSDPVSVQIVEP